MVAERPEDAAVPLDPRGERDPADRSRRYYGKDALGAIGAARVLVVGAGAVGNEVVKHLGMVGVGEVLLVDPDRVTASNLNRCVLFTPEQAAARIPKVEAIAETAQRLGWTTRIEPAADEIENLPSERWSEIDLTICGVDDDHARRYLNTQLLGFALATGRSRFLLEGAMGSDFTQARFLELPRTACLVCGWTPELLAEVQQRRRTESCLDFVVDTRPVFPAVATQTSIVGAELATEAIKILAGLPSYRASGSWPGPERMQPHLGVTVRSEPHAHTAQRATILRNPRCVEPFCRDAAAMSE